MSFRALLRRILPRHHRPAACFRCFHACGPHSKKSAIELDPSLLEEKFTKGSGPGGQKINKTSSAVQLKHIPTGVHVKVQWTRSRESNRSIARKLLKDRLEKLQLGEESRTELKAARVRKKKASSAKKARRKYRKLDAEKQETEAEDAPEDEIEDAKPDGEIEADGIVPDPKSARNVEQRISPATDCAEKTSKEARQAEP